MKKNALGLLFSPFGITQLIMVAAIATALWLSYPSWRFERTKAEIRTRYPAVSRIDVAAAAEWIEAKTGPLPVVIDVRTRAEYDFSHLPGAIHMAPSEIPPVGPSGKEAAQLIVYDTVGADSSAVAMRLTQLAYKHVMVLDGGIFEWANRDLALDGANGRTDRVNPGASPFARVLKRSHRGP